MRWNFVSNTLVSSPQNELGPTYLISADWHVPQFDLGGPSPSFQLSDQYRIQGYKLAVYLTQCNSTEFINSIDKINALKGHKTVVPENPNTWLALSHTQKQVEIRTRLPLDVFERLHRNVDAYVGAVGLKYIYGLLSVVGLAKADAADYPLPTRKELDAGHIAAFEQTIAINFAFGVEPPEAPSRSAVSEKAVEQFS
jgi:hypothetical protein